MDLASLDLILKMLDNKEPHDRIRTALETVLRPAVEDDTQELRLAQVMKEVDACDECGLCRKGEGSFGVGNPHARIVLVGEGAGEVEYAQRTPFVGPSGQLLRSLLAFAEQKLGPRWKADQLWLTNVVKGWPRNANGTIRAPELREQAVCRRYLDRELEILKPDVIICIGAISASLLIKPQFKITQEQGIWFDDKPRRIAMLHPAYVLRIGEADQLAKDRAREAKISMYNVLKTVNDYLDTLERE